MFAVHCIIEATKWRMCGNKQRRKQAMLPLFQWTDAEELCIYTVWFSETTRNKRNGHAVVMHVARIGGSLKTVPAPGLLLLFFFFLSGFTYRKRRFFPPDNGTRKRTRASVFLQQRIDPSDTSMLLCKSCAKILSSGPIQRKEQIQLSTLLVMPYP